MPWHIARNAYGCNGYAVVKDGTSEVEGCHKTRSSAERQMSALYASESKKVDKSLGVYQILTSQEKAFHDALVGIVDEFGKFVEGGDGVWVGYEQPSENDNASIGVKCGNCSFFVEGGSCQIVDADIQEDGKCRMANIPPQLVKDASRGFWNGKIGLVK